MAIDPEVRELLNALVAGRVQLAEGQQRHEESLERHEAILAKLAEGQAALSDGQVRHEALLMKLAEGQAIIHERMDRSDDRMRRFEERMKELTEAIIRGFTNGAKRDNELDDRVTALEQERG